MCTARIGARGSLGTIVIGIRHREVAHQPGRPQHPVGAELIGDAQRIGRRHPPPAHAGIDLHVHSQRHPRRGPQPCKSLHRGDGDVHPRHVRLFARHERPHHEHRDIAELVAQPARFLPCGDAQPLGARSQRRPPHRRGAVPVAVGLDDGPQLGRSGGGA